MKRCYKKITNALLSLTLFIFLIAIMYLPAKAAAFTPGFEVAAKAACLYSLDSDTILYEKMKEPMYPASMTKIMTCILALESTKDLDAELFLCPNYVQDYLYTYQWIVGNGAVSLAGLEAGEVDRATAFTCIDASVGE